MAEWQRPPTPFTIASRAGFLSLPIFLVFGLLLGVMARGWMRLISTDPEFSWQGTLGIIAGFMFFAAMQAVAAIASTRGWAAWPRRLARVLGIVGLLPLFGAAGALMAPFVVLAGLAVWRPEWPSLARGALALVALANLIRVAYTIVSDHGLSARSLLGVMGLTAVYACIVWAAAGTFASRRSARRPGAPAVSEP